MTFHVRTTCRFERSPDVIWPLLLNSRMEPEKSLFFSSGLPQPRECRLEGPRGVGARRRCISNQGEIEQKILVWDEPKCLSFRMEKTDLPFRKWIREIVETFDLVGLPKGGTAVTRTTRVEVNGRFQCAKHLAVFAALKKIH